MIRSWETPGASSTPEFRAGAVRIRIATKTGKSVAQVARDLGISPYTLNIWVQAARRQTEQPQGALVEDEHGAGPVAAEKAQ